MDMRVEKVIEELGYKPNEAKVYVAALGLGECHISDIAVKVRLPRTSTQAIVERLHKDGLMNFYVRKRYKYWVAENPERLLAHFKKREETMRGAMPALAALRKSGQGNKGQNSADQAQSVGLFRILADASSEPVLVANENAEIEYVNAAWEEKLGYSLSEVRGKNPRLLQSGKTPREVYERMWKTLTSERLFQSDCVIDKKKDGTLLNLLTTIFPVRHGNRLYYIQILDDITERKRVERLQKDFIRTAAEDSTM